MEPLQLYVLPGCPYCTKVIRKLDALELEYETIEVPSAHPDRTAVKEVSGQTGVPVLVDAANDIEGMPESNDIVAYLETQYGA